MSSGEVIIPLSNFSGDASGKRVDHHDAGNDEDHSKQRYGMDVILTLNEPKPGRTAWRFTPIGPHGKARMIFIG
jgi:hypothetical protein